MKFVGQGIQKVEPEQDRHTDRRDQTHYHVAFAGDIIYPRISVTLTEIADEYDTIR